MGNLFSALSDTTYVNKVTCTKCKTENAEDNSYVHGITVLFQTKLNDQWHEIELTIPISGKIFCNKCVVAIDPSTSPKGTTLVIYDKAVNLLTTKQLDEKKDEIPESSSLLEFKKLALEKKLQGYLLYKIFEKFIDRKLIKPENMDIETIQMMYKLMKSELKNEFLIQLLNKSKKLTPNEFFHVLINIDRAELLTEMEEQSPYYFYLIFPAYLNSQRYFLNKKILSRLLTFGLKKEFITIYDLVKLEVLLPSYDVKFKNGKIEVQGKDKKIETEETGKEIITVEETTDKIRTEEKEEKKEVENEGFVEIDEKEKAKEVV